VGPKASRSGQGAEENIKSYHLSCRELNPGRQAHSLVSSLAATSATRGTQLS